MTHVTESLAWVVNSVLLAAALAALVWWRNRLALVVCLVAADPLWTMLTHALLDRSLPPTPLLQALSVVAADAPLWAAFLMGFVHLFGAAGQG